jgi:hypothetical protein
MSVRFLPGIVLLQLAICGCGQTGTELGEQLLRKIDGQAAAAGEAKPAGISGACKLLPAPCERRSLRPRRDRRSGQGCRQPFQVAERFAEKEYPELAVASKEWSEVLTKRLTEWEAAASKEMETVARAATAKLRPARQPADWMKRSTPSQQWPHAILRCERADLGCVGSRGPANIAAVRSFMYSWQSLLAQKLSARSGKPHLSGPGKCGRIRSQLWPDQNCSRSAVRLRPIGCYRRSTTPTEPCGQQLKRRSKVENAAELDETLDSSTSRRRNYERASTRDNQ